MRIALARPILRAIDLALPPRCPVCGAVTQAAHRFCVDCWSSLRFLGPPWCASCNLPFDFDRGEDARCAACIADPPPHSGVRAAVAYGPVARSLVLKLKYGARTGNAETVARLMARLMPDDATRIVPVPLHRWRIWSRGFNQAALIGEALARRTGVAIDRDILVRAKATPVLRGLGARGRAKAVAGAFRAAPDARARVGGAHVVLVDDVHTSGATANACARILKRAGASRVTLLCWARVIGESAPD